MAAGQMACPPQLKSRPFEKYHSHLVYGREGAVFLGSGFVSAQSQAAAGMLLRQSLARTQKSSLQMAMLFLNALEKKKTLSCRAEAPDNLTFSQTRTAYTPS